MSGGGDGDNRHASLVQLPGNTCVCQQHGVYCHRHTPGPGKLVTGSGKVAIHYIYIYIHV